VPSACWPCADGKVIKQTNSKDKNFDNIHVDISKQSITTIKLTLVVISMIL